MKKDPKTSFPWQPIADLPSDYENLAQPELRSLTSIWEEQRHELQTTDAVKEFNEKLLRRWAVETGLIERIYTLDRGITQLLVERGLNASLIPHHATNKNPDLVMRLIRDQHSVAEGLFDFVASRRELSTSYIKELHAALTANQQSTQAIDQFGSPVKVPLRKGDYKLRPNNPLRSNGTLHEYCPPEHVASEMDRLVEMHLEHVKLKVPPEVEAAWIHHRFTQIHPFQDGNGRVARALATLVFLKAGWLPLVVNDSQREPYISALEEADRGDLSSLSNFFAGIEKRAFLQALSVAQEVRDLERRVHHAVAAIRDTFKRRHESLREEWGKSKEYADELSKTAHEFLQDVARDLKDEVEPLAPPNKTYSFFADHEPSGGNRDNWFRYQIIQTAKDLGYFANMSFFHTWARLGLETDGRSEILVSFHGIGHEFRGLLVATACYFRRDITEEMEKSITEVLPLTDEPFQINYRESMDDLQDRFERWLNPIIVTGLEMFRRRV